MVLMDRIGVPLPGQAYWCRPFQPYQRSVAGPRVAGRRAAAKERKKEIIFFEDQLKKAVGAGGGGNTYSTLQAFPCHISSSSNMERHYIMGWMEFS